MGAYLNPGKEAFEEAVNSEIFIDKTEMLGYLNTIVKTKHRAALFLGVDRKTFLKWASC